MMPKRLSGLPLHAAIIYLLTACLWIFLSDVSLLLFTSDHDVLTTFQTYKGFLFVTVTSLLLFFTLRNRLQTIDVIRAAQIHSEQLLSRSEERFFAYFHANPVALVIFRRHDGSIIEVNTNFLKITGATREELEAIGAPFFRMDPPLEELLNTYGAVRQYETSIPVRSGQTVSVLVSVEQVDIHGESSLLASFLDISERKKAEQEVAKLNRVNRVLTNINQLIVRRKNIQEVFQDACTIAVEDSQFMMAWIGIRNPVTNILDVAASAGRVQDYLAAINIDFNDPVRSSGPCGRAVTTGVHQYITDIDTEPTMAPWREDAMRTGYRSSAAFPLTVQGTVTGALTLYAGERNFFTRQELALLDELAADISFAMDLQRKEEQQQKIYDALQENEAIFSQFMEHSPIYVFFKDEQLRTLRLSRNYEQLLGRPMKELLGRSMEELFPTELAQSMTADDMKILRGGTTVRTEEEMNGRYFETIKFPITLNGVPRYLAGYTIDITESKRSETVLRDSEIMLNKAQHFAKLGSWTWFITTDRLEWSEEMYHIFGIEKSTFTGNLADVIATSIHPDDRVSVERANQRVISESETVPLEYRVVRADGSLRTVWAEAGEMILDDSGSPVSLSGTVQDITERKAAEVQLRESEERLRLSLTAAKQGLFDLNIQTGEAITNPEYATMLGYDPVTFVETNAFWIERLHPDDKERTAQTYTDYVEGRLDEYRVEFRQRTAIGGWKWILSVGKIIAFTEEGRPLRMLGTHTDIDDLKQAEQTVSLQMTALESAANGIVITDLHGTIVWANRAFFTFTGYSAEEAVGAKPSILKSGRHSPAFYQQLWETIMAGKTWSGIVVNKRKDGTLYDDEMSITPVRNGSGVITHFVAVKQDVTERNRTHQRIKEQAMLLDEAHDAIILRDLHHTILYWNKGAERLFGWTSAEAVGQDARQLIYHDIHEHDTSLLQLFRDGFFSGEFALQNKTHHNITVDIRLNIINDELGTPQSILSVSNDITERKKIESQFLRAQRMESIGTLAGGIAHDLNNMLGPILLSTQILNMKVEDDSLKGLLATIESCSLRAKNIISQVLGFARGADSKPMEIQLRHIVKEVCNILTETFPRDIAIQSYVPNDLWVVKADPTQLHQVLMNLCVNARDAMPYGGVLTINVKNTLIDKKMSSGIIDAREGNFVEMEVRDTGSGIPPEHQQKIFDPFFTTKEIGKGTGLGLSTVFSIVKQHNGFITLSSTPGEGTSFQIYIPASSAPQAAAAESAAAKVRHGDRETILVVDDEESVRIVCEETLRFYNYLTESANNGAEAISMFIRPGITVDLVLMDIMMPVMDGKTAAAAIRKIRPNVKIIGMSGLMTEALGEEGNSLFDHFLRKPFTGKELMEAMESLLHQRKGPT
jgi:PAS domain S-box-containing protein